MEFDVALDLDDFRTLMEGWNEGVYAWQCTSDQPPSISIAREKRGRGRALVDCLRGLGIHLLIESPGQHDLTMLASHSAERLRAALERFGPPS